jgi:hypothetical protein
MVDNENTMGSYSVVSRSLHALENTDFTPRQWIVGPCGRVH